MRMILIVLSALTIHSASFAATAEHQGIQAALDARNDFVRALVNKDFSGITHQGFEYAIRELAAELKAQYGDDAMATSLLDQWNHSSGNFNEVLAARSMNKDLGDHSPLFPWINSFLGQASDKYGSIIMTLPVVKDILMLNYSIPVVFQPHGAWQTSEVDSRIEYRKHFIPFVNLVTHYTTLYGCQYAVTRAGAPNLKKICSKVSDELVHVMGRYLAPAISDWIFKAGNRSFNVTDQQLQYSTADELRSAIQN